MDEQTLALYLGSVLAGTVEAMAGKIIEGPMAKLAQRAKEALGGPSLSEAEVAVREAVEGARREIRADYFAGEDDLSIDMVALLDHRPFAEAVARRLLIHGQPDFPRLREAYLAQRQEDGQEANARWQALELPLGAFFDAIERRLAADPRLGPVVRHAQQMARQGRQEEIGALIAQRSEEIALLDQALLAAAGKREAQLDEITGLLRELLTRLGADSGAAAGPVRLTVEERTYLQRLQADCDLLLLAEEKRDLSRRPGPRASLRNVYVDLETTAEPSLEQVLDRLGVPREKREEVLGELGAREAVAGRTSPRRPAPVGELPQHRELLAMLQDRPGKSHPLRPWAEDETALRRALQPLTVLEALTAHPHLVLLGDPGSGKSTFVNHLAMTFAGGLLATDPGWRATLEDRYPEPLFPLRILLRRWSKVLQDGDGADDGEGVDRLYRHLEELTAVPKQRWLERFQDPRTLVLFDGLDEVPAAPATAHRPDRRRQVVAAVEEFCRVHRQCRVLVTCRVKPYDRPTYRLPGLPVLTLAPLDRDRVRRFTFRWYDEQVRIGRLDPDEAAGRRDRLLQAVASRPVLGEMAETPLLLTMLAQVNARAPLPEGRAELYGDCVEQLLWKWEQRITEGGGIHSLASLLDEPERRLERIDVELVLWRLTYQLHGAEGEGAAGISADALRKGLAGIHPDPDEQGWAWASRVVALMRERGGLLVETDEELFTFPHRSFQEYLAARWLAGQKKAPLVAKKLGARDTWREVILLACAYLRKEGSTPQVLALVTELVGSAPPEQEADWRRILVAGQAWYEFGPHRAEGAMDADPGRDTGSELGEDMESDSVGAMGADLARRIPPLLDQALQHPGLPPAQRLEAGLLLADLGVLPEDLDERVEIPAGRWGASFQIGKYPVTNAQYRRFVAAGGYQPDQPWWNAKAQKEIGDWEKEVGRDEWPSGPRLQDDPRFNRATQPVTGVSWYEACAYCAWLTRRWREEGSIGEAEEVRLPTVAEWEWAAAGPKGRKYPWGKDPDATKANTKESGLGQPTPVHMYPAGASAEGVYDLAGNVWEWTGDQDEAISAAKVLVGGAWWSSISEIGAAARTGPLPYVRVGVGFRLVVVPVSRSNSEF